MIDRADLLAELKTRSEQIAIPEVGRNQLHLMDRVASGAFGTVYQARVDSVPEYGSLIASGPRLVAAKYLPNTSEKDKYVYPVIRSLFLFHVACFCSIVNDFPSGLRREWLH